MPTLLPRITVTETGDLAAALAAAAIEWPDDATSRSRLLLRLAFAGQAAILAAAEHGPAARRREAIDRTSGSLTGVYPPDARAVLRAEWPA